MHSVSTINGGLIMPKLILVCAHRNKETMRNAILSKGFSICSEYSNGSVCKFVTDQKLKGKNPDQRELIDMQMDLF